MQPDAHHLAVRPVLARMVVLAAVLPSLFWTTASLADELTGEQVFASKCAVCHGPHGEGTKKHPERLEGDRSVAQLSELIGKEMPEDKPGTLPAKEIDVVSHYVYDTLYSPLARERNRPARIELARLTVAQYRNAVADIVGGFQSSLNWDGQQGLQAHYYEGRDFNDGRRKLERFDPQVDFNFGVESPLPGKIDSREFALRWSGSVLAPDTGDYEFIVNSDQAVRLWINDDTHPIVDAWVKSGDNNDHRGSIYLLGGRPYRVRLEFSKAKQGVNDGKDKKGKIKPASISLLWKRPHGVEELVPARQLSPAWNPEACICATPFPPDDRSYGWERGTTVSKEWDQATTDAALETAAAVAIRVNQLAGTNDKDGDRPKKLKAFCRTFAERAFRRPLNNDEAAAIVDKPLDGAKDLDGAVQHIVLRVLKSPRFLYREVGAPSDAFDTAARLSFGLWDSIPDQDLWNAAASGNLKTKEQVAQHSERMLGNLRAKFKLRAFLFKWVKADEPRDLTKDAEKFPGFDGPTITDLRTSLELQLDKGLWSDGADFRQLLLGDSLFLNGRLAELYNVDLPRDAGFTEVKLDPTQRAGVLTHPYLMATFAHTKDSSPILRGVLLARGVLAVSLKPPPEAVAPLAAELQPTLTTRQRVALQTKSANCMTCHGIINPLGYTLEHFDSVGRYRSQDNGKPVDATGTYHTRSGQTVTIDGARELAGFLIASDESQAAFTEQLFHHLVQQPVRAYGPSTLKDLRKSFADRQFNIRKLAVEIMATSALTPRDAKVAVASK